MTTLYRAISSVEMIDFNKDKIFRTSRNTIEAKQFFKSRKAIKEFVESSKVQEFDPAYEYLLIISVENDCLIAANQIEISLDGFDAVTIEDKDLVTFSNCVNFVREEIL